MTYTLSPAVHTIGHSTHPLGRFVELLGSSSVEVVYDIRSLPQSRFAPQFDRAPLTEALANTGISYVFCGRELGGRPGGQHLGSLAAKMTVYDEIRATPEFERGVARIKAAASGYNLALLCSEEDPLLCHRHLLVAPALEALGLTVLHIRSQGPPISEAQMTLSHSEKALKIMGRQLSLLPFDLSR